jgi:hypothetical protein
MSFPCTQEAHPAVTIASRAGARGQPTMKVQAKLPEAVLAAFGSTRGTDELGQW